MQFKHAPAAVSAIFDDPNLVSAAGLVPMLRLARSAGLDELAQSRLSVPTDKGANAGGKVMALVAGMLAGADSIDDMNVLRHGGMGRLFDRTYAPSTLGSFLREFRFGHVRQLDAVARSALRPRTPEYANEAPCFWYPWTSMIVSSRSTITRSWGEACSSGAVDARFTSVREATASSWRTCPNRNSRRNDPSVDGAYVR